MTTIAPDLATATVFAAQHPGVTHLAAAAQSATAAGPLTLAILILTVMLLTALARAVRGLAILLAPLVRLAMAMTSVLLVTVLSGLLLLVILLHG